MCLIAAQCTNLCYISNKMAFYFLTQTCKFGALRLHVSVPGRKLLFPVIFETYQKHVDPTV